MNQAHDSQNFRLEEPAPHAPGSATQDVSGQNATGYNFRKFSGNFYAGAVSYSDSQFFTPDLEEFGSSWVEPTASSQLVGQLKQNRVLFLAGNLRDKDDCALHIARLFQEKERTECGLEVNVRVLVPSSDPVPLEQELTERKPSLLVLRDITPRQILGSEIARLTSLVGRTGGYVIITTPCSKPEWLPGGADPLEEAWYGLLWENYYGKELLSHYLVAQIQQSQSDGPGRYLSRASSPQELANGITIDQLVTALQGPRAVKEFAHYVTAREELPSKKEIQERLRAISEDSGAIQFWVQHLAPEQKTLLLGLCLLDGLPEDVLFDGLEELVSACWRKSDPLLRHFEYNDLVPFALYFKQTHSSEDLTRIECVSPNTKKHIIQVLWRLHRRHFIGSMSTVAGLVRQSASSDKEDNESTAQDNEDVAPQGDKSEISPSQGQGSTRQSNQLHRALIEGLRLFGQISPKAVNPIFFRLAQDADESVRRFVARTLAAWITHGEGDQVVSLLMQWWSHSRPQRSRSSLQSLVQAKSKPSYRMRSTIALAVAFAAPLYRSNQLPFQLVQLLMELLEDTSKEVQRSVNFILVPTVLEYHLASD